MGAAIGLALVKLLLWVCFCSMKACKLDIMSVSFCFFAKDRLVALDRDGYWCQPVTVQLGNQAQIPCVRLKEVNLFQCWV